MPFIREGRALCAPGAIKIVRIVVGLVLLAGLALAAPATSAVPKVSVTPASVLPGESLAVSWSEIGTARRHDWLGLYTPGDPDVAYRAYAFTNGLVDGTLTFALPANVAAGTYELRLFSKGLYRRIAVSNAFKVRNPPPRSPSPAATLTVSPATIASGDAVTVTWTDVVGAAPNDWIGLFKPNASDKAFRSYLFTSGAASGSVSFPIPSRLADGSYELRLFGNGTFTRIAVSNRFAVSDRPSQPPTPQSASLAATPASVVAGAMLTAAWNGVPAAGSGDWVGLFLRDAPDSAYLARQNTGGTAAGNVTITVPPELAAGVHQLRFLDAAGVRLATSNDVNISRPAASATLTASPASVAAGTAVTASWSGISAPAAGDWIGLYRNGATDSAYVARGDTGGSAAGTVSISVPLTTIAGGHELRLFGANGSARLAVSNAVAVTPAPEAQIYFIHTDHLNTPRVITNAAGQPVWRWDNMDPFGVNAPDENPSGLGTFTCNLRFPGQYFDRETNLHYNYFRDYDAALGRYIQSDPKGLDAGINTYGYALANPIKYRDQFGLDTCGSGVTEGLVPDNPFLFPFSWCCRKHDDCYDNCWTQPTRAECDENFCGCMRQKCERYSYARFFCERAATLYCNAAVSRGQPYFEASRKKCRGGNCSRR